MELHLDRGRRRAALHPVSRLCGRDVEHATAGNDRAGRCELQISLGWAGGREILITPRLQFLSHSSKLKAPASAGAFLLKGLVSRPAGASGIAMFLYEMQRRPISHSYDRGHIMRSDWSKGRL